MNPPGVVLGVNPSTLMGSRGEGVATQYCKNVLAWNFCKPRGRESCPSCAQIAKNQSPACAQDPALCLAQNSPSEIEKAKLSCPTDPAFSDPNYAGGTGTQPPSTVGGSMPAVILPQSVSGADGSAGAANREGYANGPSDSAYSGNGSSSGVSTSYSTASVGGRELAQLGGGAAGFKPSNMGGPASDVEGQYGPSLFTTSTQVIRKRCQAGKLKNCP